MALKKMKMKFYYVDGSEQYVTVNTDSLELAEQDHKKRIMENDWIEVSDDNGWTLIIQTKNIINVTFNEA